MCSLLAFPGVSCLSDPHIYSTVQFSFILHSFHSFSSVLTDPFFNSMFSHHHMTFAFLPICCSILIFLSPSSIFSPSSHSSGLCLQFSHYSSILHSPFSLIRSPPSILSSPVSFHHSTSYVFTSPCSLLLSLTPPFSLLHSHFSILISPLSLLYSHSLLFCCLTSPFPFLP